MNIIEDWNVLEEYAGEKLGFYQLLEGDGSFEIRVQTGRVGFKREFEDPADDQLIRILTFCRKHCYIKVCYNTREDAFFK